MLHYIDLLKDPLSNFRDICITEGHIIIGISEKVIPNNRTVVSLRFYIIMNCINLRYEK